MSKDALYVMREGYTKVGLEELIEYVGSFINTKESTMIEIGSYAGESTELFAEHFKKVISIDPFYNNYDANDITSTSFMDLTDVYKVFSERISKYENIIHIRKTSDDAVEELSNAEVALVYIDGLHTYDQVLKDIKNYKPLLRREGFMCGHDYTPHWQGVLQAINESLGVPDQTFQDGSWVKRLLE